MTVWTEKRARRLQHGVIITDVLALAIALCSALNEPSNERLAFLNTAVIALLFAFAMWLGTFFEWFVIELTGQHAVGKRRYYPFATAVTTALWAIGGLLVVLTIVQRIGGFHWFWPIGALLQTACASLWIRSFAIWVEIKKS